MSALLTARDSLCLHSYQWTSKYVQLSPFSVIRYAYQEQVLSGVLPISRISAVPFCVHQLARLLPLEQILELTHPFATNSTVTFTPTSDRGSASHSSKPSSNPRSKSKPVPTLVEDKRTWRPGQRPPEQIKVQSKAPDWTANDIMIAYAEKKGWVTAKAGRPDIHRAGNASGYLPAGLVRKRADRVVVLRLVAEGKIPWAFWPPGSSISGGDGIWLKDGVQRDAWDEDEDRDEEESDSEEEMEELSSEEGDTENRIKIENDESDEEDEDNEDEEPVRGGNLGRFGALRIE